MAEPRAFISFDFDNNEQSRRLFVGQGKEDSPTPFVIQDWSSKAALEEDEWEEKIAAKIAVCNMVIVLVGRSMGSAYGVAAEIAMAKDKNVPVFGVYVDHADTTSTLPSGLARGRVIGWKWDTIARAIEQMMGEGKNA
ncbi:TIR domain-containing protein [Microbacterium sp. CFBP 8790]|uniref:TIR domain-containing protein n=1 Tax=unclassified Microbacterium TaxID=2609290 RepID=UPI00177B90CA|nr:MULTISPECIES: TIR domain-containing protein [unclassified Microbacterium]MBD8207772.1 TIR domain-containing protein [Microbacterium sp. CFBP 8801]MBD8510340.1 TIR domain-containing protein [Microbacterium sp. CFBP 8790]